MASKLPKAFYSEPEAARSLGVSAQEFRSLLQHHLGASEAETDKSGETTYHASDVLLLKLFVAGRLPVPPPQPKPAPVAEEEVQLTSDAALGEPIAETAL